jgi:hypothetical protein
MANPNFDEQIRARIRSFTHELTELVRRSALESLRSALGAPNRRGGAAGRGRSAAASALPPPSRGRFAGRGRAAAGRPRGRGKGVKRDPQELAQLTDSLYSHIQSNPGQRIEEIARAMGTSTKELNLPAKKLIQSKQVKTRGHKRATQYYPK